jgi:hypothetical protein
VQRHQAVLPPVPAVKVYVVTAPLSLRGIYDTWPACEKVVAGVRGARYQSAASRAEAEAILHGEVVTRPSRGAGGAGAGEAG